jgi:hypothetical protein
MAACLFSAAGGEEAVSLGKYAWWPGCRGRVAGLRVALGASVGAPDGGPLAGGGLAAVNTLAAYGLVVWSAQRSATHAGRAGGMVAGWR